MRAYSCIDRRGRWTELPTQVNIATYQALRPTQSPAAVIDIEDAESQPLEEDSTRAGLPRGTKGSPAQAFDELEEDAEDDDPGDDPKGSHPNAVKPEYSNPASRSDATACAGLPRGKKGPPAQAFDELEEDAEDDDPKGSHPNA